MLQGYKPLGMKAYGHIAHLPSSRMGPSDHKCHEGQARIATEKVRDRHDKVIVQEKVDGSNVCVLNASGVLWALTRAGYEAHTSPYKMHHYFEAWVRQNEERFRAVLQPGERLCGEWMMQAHGTRYKLLGDPFIAFDIMTGHRRLPFEQFRERVQRHFQMPALMSNDAHSVPVSEALEWLGTHGHHGAIDATEGCVWRVERNGEVDFVVKWVYPSKIDGQYLPNVSGKPPVWNWEPWEHGIYLNEDDDNAKNGASASASSDETMGTR